VQAKTLEDYITAAEVQRKRDLAEEPVTLADMATTR
jgi:hypothetical protein